MELETNTETTRKLASIQRVDVVDQHPNADRLELLTVLGWQVCEVKGAVKSGDIGVYCEIDSMVPGDAPWLPEAVKQRVSQQADPLWYRIKTIKLRGQLTQGLFMPLTQTLTDTLKAQGCQFEVDENVTHLLGIDKYEKPAFTGQFAAGSRNGGIPFPSHLLDKTDELRVQSNKKLFDMLQKQPFYATVKMDGTSFTCVRDPDTSELLVCSRNQVRPKPDNIDDCPYHQIAVKYNLDTILTEHPDMAVQGEICGPNVQGNKAKLTELQLFVFNVVDVPSRQGLSFDNLVNWCQKVGLPMVPIAQVGNSFEHESIKQVLSDAEGFYPGTKNQREGLVFRSQDQKISFKAINNEFLLQNKE